MTQNSRTSDLTSGPMLQKIILFSLPLAASSILQLLFNAADVVVVGRFAGSTALAAVGSNGALINLLVCQNHRSIYGAADCPPLQFVVSGVDGVKAQQFPTDPTVPKLLR